MEIKVSELTTTNTLSDVDLIYLSQKNGSTYSSKVINGTNLYSNISSKLDSVFLNSSNLSLVSNSSGNWNSTYTTVCANSAGWAGGGDLSLYLPVSGGTITGNLNVIGTINYGVTRMASSYYIDATTIDTILTSGDIFQITITGDSTFNNPYNPTDGRAYTWWVYQDGTGGHVITLDSKFKLPTSATSPLSWSVSANAMDMLTVRYSSKVDKYYVVAFVPGY